MKAQVRTCGRCRTRTCDPRLVRAVLSPAELNARRLMVSQPERSVRLGGRRLGGVAVIPRPWPGSNVVLGPQSHPGLAQRLGGHALAENQATAERPVVDLVAAARGRSGLQHSVGGTG